MAMIIIVIPFIISTLFPLCFLLLFYILKKPLLSFRITKAECSVVPLCIIIFITKYNHLVLSLQTASSVTWRLRPGLLKDFYSAGCSQVISQNTFCRFSPAAALCDPVCFLWSVLFHAFLFFIYLMFYSFFYKNSTNNLYIFYKFAYVFLCIF